MLNATLLNDFDQDYMNSQQQQFFREQLLNWRQHLSLELQKSSQRICSNDDDRGDIIDQSVNEHNRMMAFISRQRTQQTIAQINAALQRLDDGSYGYCLISGEEIGLQRLAAYPIATLAVEIQQLLENRQKRQ